jgi:hypothetical protein
MIDINISIFKDKCPSLVWVLNDKGIENYSNISMYIALLRV